MFDDVEYTKKELNEDELLLDTIAQIIFKNHKANATFKVKKILLIIMSQLKQIQMLKVILGR